MFLQRLRPLRGQRGLTLVEALIVIAIIGIIAAIAFPLYENVQRRARIAQAQNNAREIAHAVLVYTAHAGTLPAALDDITHEVTVNGVASGPFMKPVLTPPTRGGWPATYTYTVKGRSFSITASGDAATITVP